MAPKKKPIKNTEKIKGKKAAVRTKRQRAGANKIVQLIKKRNEKAERSSKSLLKSAELKKYRDILLKMRADLTHNIDRMKHGALRKHTDASATSPIHMADVGTDNFEQEFTLNLIQNEGKALVAIDEAIDKIDSGEYGICEDCRSSIPLARLMAIPYATLCVRCKEKQEK